MIYDITQYGAIPDGKTVCTKSIQKAIDDCAKTGGKIVIPTGYFVSGSLQLRSNIELHLEQGARLICSTNSTDQIDFLKNMQDDNKDTGWEGGCFLFAIHEKNIVISGDGVIDGQGHFYYYDDYSDGGLGECPLAVKEPRPRMTYLEDIQDLTIRNVTFEDAAFWTLHFAGCKDVLVEHIRIKNNVRCPNNDGIDPDCCQNVLIHNCDIQSADDCIVIKSTAPMARKYGGSSNIVISSCILHSHCTALKMGTESWGDIHHIIISDCILRDCNRGFGIYSRDGGMISDILLHHLTGNTRAYSDCTSGGPGIRTWWGKGNPLFLSATKRAKVTRTPGPIKRISMDHIYLNCEGSAVIAGEPYSQISEISIKESKFNYQRQSNHIPSCIDERPSERGCYAHEPCCLYLRSAEQLNIPESVFHVDDSMQPIIKNVIAMD